MRNVSLNRLRTRKNVRSFLQNVNRWQRISQRSALNLQSPIYSEMPRERDEGNRTEMALIQIMDAQKKLVEIEKALSVLSETSRVILQLTYFQTDKLSNVEIGKEMNYSAKNIERLKAIALIEFAEAYNHCELCVFDRNREIIGKT